MTVWVFFVPNIHGSMMAHQSETVNCMPVACAPRQVGK